MILRLGIAVFVTVYCFNQIFLHDGLWMKFSYCVMTFYVFATSFYLWYRISGAIYYWSLGSDITQQKTTLGRFAVLLLTLLMYAAICTGLSDVVRSIAKATKLLSL